MNVESQNRNYFKYAAPILLIFFAAFLCFWNSLSGQFVGDDQIVVKNNRNIRSLSTLPNLFTSNYWGEGYNDGTYRPLTNLSFALNYAIGGLDPWGYHLLNVLLHALSGMLVFLLVRRYTKRDFLSLAAALLFIVHPVHVEAVSQIAGRTEPLAAVFMLCAWICYINKERRAGYYFLSLALYLLALLVKESAIVLIGILALADLCSQWAVWKERIAKLLPYYAGYAAVALLYVIIRFGALGGVGIPRDSSFFKDAPFSTRLFTMGPAFTEYFRLMAWPQHLCADYDFSLIPQAVSLDVRAASSLAAVALLFVCGALLLWRNRLIAFAVLFFFVAMSTVSNIVFPTGILIAERVLYLPVITVSLTAGAGLDWICKRNGTMRWLSVALCAILIAAAGARSYMRNWDWMNEEAFSRALVRDAPSNPKSHLALAGVYASSGRYVEAEAEYRQAALLAPEKAATRGALGDFLVKRGRYDEALPELQKSLEIFPKLGNVQIAMARICNHHGKFAEAVQFYRKGVPLLPPDPALHQEIAVALYNLGDFENAKSEFERALELNPDLAEAHFNLALLLRSLNRLDDAIAHFRSAAALEPNNAETRNAFGAALVDAGKLDEAAKEFIAAVKARSDFAEARNNLGAVYGRQGRYEEAKREFEEALKINPNYASASRNLEQLKRIEASRLQSE